MREGERALAHYVRKQPTSYICRERISAHTHSGSSWLAGCAWWVLVASDERTEGEKESTDALHTRPTS